VPSFLRLCEDAGIQVCLAVTQPDRAIGRHGTPKPSPVARAARERDVPLLQPERMRSAPELLDRLRTDAPDAIAVVAYGKILLRDVLELPRLGCVNVHASLLPRYRGASPVQAAILAGDSMTGVATMKMTERLDEGPIYLERPAPIASDDTGATLSSRLAGIGADLLIETFHGLAAGTLSPHPQLGEPTYCRTIRKSDGEIDWTRTSDFILRQRRAYTPWPGIFTWLGGERVRILEARPGPSGLAGSPGAIAAVDAAFAVVCGERTSLLPTSLQREGRNSVEAAEFFRGARYPLGEPRFGR